VLDEYLMQIRSLLDSYARPAFVLDVSINSEVRPGDQAYLNGVITFADGSELHYAEFLDASSQTVEKLMYRYHYQDRTGQLVFRYDNARHQPPMLSSSHKHLPEQVVASIIPTLDDVLAEITAVMGWA
jgi:Family of unknown function (DUF6516)